MDVGVGTLPRIRLEDGSGGRRDDNVWHMARHDSSAASGVVRSSKVVSEIFLTRLLSTKVILVNLSTAVLQLQRFGVPRAQ